MKFLEINPFDELFTHVSDDGGTQTTYNVTALFEHVKVNESKVQLVSVPVDEEHARYCLDYRGAEPERIAVLVENPEYLKKPVVFIAMPNGEHLLVDGTHRYVVFWIAKAKTIPAYIVPLALVEAFVIEDMPSPEDLDMLMGYSGIAELRRLRGGMQ